MALPIQQQTPSNINPPLIVSCRICKDWRIDPIMTVPYTWIELSLLKGCNYCSTPS